MSTKEPHERLALARERAGYATATDAARAFGWNENTYRSHENGERGIKAKIAQKYARAFKVSSAFILIDEKYERDIENSSILIFGAVRESGKIFKYDYSNRKVQDVHAAFLPSYFRDGFDALEIENDNNHLNLLKGDLIIIRNTLSNRDKIDKFLNKICVVEDFDKNWYIGYVYPGTKSSNILLICSMTEPGKMISPKKMMPVVCKFYAEQWGSAPIALWSEDESDQGG